MEKQKRYLEDKCLESFALDSDGFVYVVTVQEKGENVRICGCFSDSDLAYFCGIKLRQPFRVEKHHIYNEENMKPTDLQDKDISGLDKTGEYKGGAVASLCFDNAGSLLEFRNSEQD